SWSQQSRVSIDTRDEDGIRTILLAPALGDTRARDLSTAGLAGSFEGQRTLSATPNSALRFGLDLERQHLDTAYRAVSGGQPAGDGLFSGGGGRVGAGGVLSRAGGSRVRAGAFASGSWMPVSLLRLFGAIRWDHIGDSDF